MMNAWDKSNFEFIMKMSQKDFEEWICTINDDDTQYALALFAQAREELNMTEVSLYDTVVDYTEAQGVLAKFTLGGKIKQGK